MNPAALPAVSRGARAAAVILAVCCAGSQLSCHGTPASAAPPPPTQPQALAAADLTDVERKYGRAPARDANVTYGRDVVIVDGGANIIRALSPDGLTWTIDPHAPHASELEVGKIAFVTGRCVGR